MKKQPRVQLFLEQVFLRGSNLIVTYFRTAKIIKFWPWLDKCPLEAGFPLAKPGPRLKCVSGVPKEALGGSKIPSISTFVKLCDVNSNSRQIWET